MIAALLLALPAILLIGAATPRQADLLFGNRLRRAGRKTLRLAGFVLLAFSLGAALVDPDQARAFVTWVGGIGVEALLVALAFTRVGAAKGRRD
jgi:hypothetical protein